MGRNLHSLFSPRSIAVIGASPSPEKVGAIILKNILASQFSGKLYPVNLNRNSINGLKCYPSIMDLPEVVDLALIAIPAAGINQILEEIGSKGVKNIVVYAAGFKEIGSNGKILEEELIKTSQKYGFNLLGPNCLGFVNKDCPLNATFGQSVHQKGDLRFISQSGALAASLFDYCNLTGLGFSEFITLGNKSVVNENDILNYFLEKDTKNEISQRMQPIGLYLESISNGQDFLKISSELSKRNPLFIIKPGKTTSAVRAMRSHTGAIAGEDAVLDVALKEAGIVRCDTLEEYFDLAKAFAWEKAPVGPKVAIISNAGGPAVISSDAVEKEGLELVEFDSETKKKLHQFLPRFASVMDPVDVLGDALSDRFSKACEVILQTTQAQSLVVILTPQIMTQIVDTARAIGTLAKKYNKPIFCSFIGGSLVAKGEQVLNDFKIPSFHFPERAISTIGLMWKWKKWLQKINDIPTSTNIPVISSANSKIIKTIMGNAVKKNQKSLDNFDTNKILSLSGINTPPTQRANDLNEAKKFIQDNHWPVVLKLSSLDLLHKQDIGGVIKNISSDKELKKAITELNGKIAQTFNPRKDVAKQIQKQIVNGTEVIVGIKKDPTFGPVLLFGAGGSLAELIDDKNLHLLPINLEDAKKLVEKSKIYKILKGYRGEPPLALDKLYEVVMRLGILLESLTQASEIEINPLIVTKSDVWAVDGKVVLVKHAIENHNKNVYDEIKMENNITPLNKLLDLTGKTAIVTGGALGIGRGITYRLAEAGANVVIANRTLEEAEKVAAGLTKKGWKVKAIHTDVSVEEDVKQLVDLTVKEFGGIDILVNNAGIYPSIPVHKMTLADFESVLKVNLFGVFMTTKYVSEQMIVQGKGGKIINITSIDALHPSSIGLAHYDASKHGVWGFTKNCALELSQHNISVNAIAPGGIVTEGVKKMQSAMPAPQGVDMSKVLEAFLAKIPMHRMGLPDDIGKVTLFLASDMSSYMTGSQIVVDGGVLLS